MQTRCLLIVDDEKDIRKVICEYAKKEGYHVLEAEDGKEAFQLLQTEVIDLMILDVMMPKLDGMTLLESLSSIKKKVPTIILSALDDEVDKLAGFEMGIDDYLCKPFSPKELMARIKAVLNRVYPSMPYYEKDGLVVHFLEHTVFVDGKQVFLTPKEFELLQYFITKRKIAISREELLKELWGYHFYDDDRTIDTHIKMLRNNLGCYRKFIVTVRGVGYKFDDEA